MTILNKVTLQVKNGREKVGINFTGFGSMFQDESGKVFFNKKTPVYFEFLGYDFDGPVYSDVTESNRNRNEKSKNKSKNKEKEKFTMGGIALGVATGGLSMVAGVGKGSKKKNGKSKGVGTVNEEEQSISVTKKVEVPSIATLNFEDENEVPFSILVVCDSNIENSLKNFKIKEVEVKKELVDSSKTIVEQLKDFKDLLDLGIITQEEFDAKKIELLN